MKEAAKKLDFEEAANLRDREAAASEDGRLPLKFTVGILGN